MYVCVSGQNKENIGIDFNYVTDTDKKTSFVTFQPSSFSSVGYSYTSQIFKDLGIMKYYIDRRVL